LKRIISILGTYYFSLLAGFSDWKMKNKKRAATNTLQADNRGFSSPLP